MSSPAHAPRSTAWGWDIVCHAASDRTAARIASSCAAGRTGSHTARTVPGGSDPALLVVTEVTGGLCWLPAEAVVQARTWLRLLQSRRVSSPRGLTLRLTKPSRRMVRRNQRLFRARAPPTDSEEPAEHARSASRPLPSLPSHTSVEMRSRPARLQGVAPPTSPLRPRAVASTGPPASSMGLVPLRGTHRDYRSH
jgi:hypothetical protein